VRKKGSLEDFARALGGCLIAGAALGSEVAYSQGPAAAVIATNSLCGPSNATAMVRTLKPQPASTVRMIERIKAIRDATNPQSQPFMNPERVKMVEKELAAETNPRKKVSLGFTLAIELLNAGRPEAALRQIQTNEAIITSIGFHLDAHGARELRRFKATAQLRLGEQENCVANHNAESCLFPLSPAAVHKLERGSRGAIPLLMEQLKDSPQDLSARWLLNLAYMTLGEYPEKVPAPWLIPPQTFQSDCAFPHFPDVAGPLGVDVCGEAGGVILDDFDNDGFIDIMVSSWEFDGGLHYFHNDGDGHFSDRTADAGLAGLMGGLNIQQTDYNNDGLLDLWVLRGAWTGKAGRIPPSLLRNNGDGTFTDVTEEAGLLKNHPSNSSVWFDYDGDGWLDLFIACETTDPNDPDPCLLYHNNHDGTFTECAAAGGLEVKRFIKGVTTLDYDNDGRPDLYLSCRDGENMLFHNDGPDASGQWKFSDATKRSGLRATTTFPTWSFDYDNDGWEDIFISGYAARGVGDIAADYLGLPLPFKPGNSASESPGSAMSTQSTTCVPLKLYHNNRDGTFTDVTDQMHLNHVVLTMGCNFGDLDNDGWLDFYLGTGNPEFTMLTPHRMFRNAEGKGFQDVTTAGGFGSLQKGHGVGFADLANDGNQDVYEEVGGAYTGDTAYNVLFLNPGNTNRWLKLKLIGTKSNRAAIGARIKVRVQTPNGPRDIYRTVNSGGSFGSNPLRQEIGLGNATKIETVEINWPASGIHQDLRDLELDHFYHVTEGDAKALAVALKRVHFDLSAAPRPHSMMMEMAR
jgi:hypothetical protein